MITDEALTKGINEIPPLPTAVTDAIDLLNKEQVDFDKLQNCIAQDAGLSGRVLSVSNSAFYGMPSEVGSIKESCVILGTYTLRNIIIAAGMIGKFPADSGKNLNLSDLWYHSYGTAIAARILAYQCNVDPDKAFTAGLLHDFGKMVLDVYFNEQYQEVIKYRDSADCLLRDAEKHLLGFTHSRVGGMVASRWNLPQEIVDAIRGHHMEETNISPVVDLVHVADIVSRVLDIGDAGDSLIPEVDEDVLQRLGLTILDVGKTFDKIELAMESAKEIID